MSKSGADVAQVKVRYIEAPEPTTEQDAFSLAVPTDGFRAGARLEAEFTRPGVARDALLTMGEILASDLRFKARDRSDYLAYLLAQGKRATQAVWDAQKEFLEDKYGEATQEERPLDPILSVSEDQLSLEVFSRDESAYACLQLKAGEAYTAGEVKPGTTHVDLTPRLMMALGRMRSYRKSTLRLTPSEGGEERALQVPYRWLRAFGQVQAASTLPAQSFDISAVDLYNVLLTLRLRKAKKPPRALRYELVPGEVPRLVLEPWDIVLEGTGGPYEGMTPQVVRTWGRKRLGVLARLLPHAKRVTVHLVGAGLPAFYVVDLGDATLTLALSGWTDSGWAGIATFDLLVPGAVDDLLIPQIGKALAEGPRSLDSLSEGLGRDKNEVRQALLMEMSRGQVVHDIGSGVFRSRPMVAEALDADKLRYRDEREEQAHRLLAVEGQVKLTKVHDLGGEGVRIEGEVEDRQAHRTYVSSFTIDREGRTVGASCSSPQFRRSGLREGPTVPMIAIRLLFARQQTELEKARNTPEGRKLIRAETRTMVKRNEGRSMVYRVSLDDRQVVLRWGDRPEQMRMNRLLFGDAEEARSEYFMRLDQLGAKGFIDASAAEAI